MKKILIAVALAASLGLSACATTGGTATGGITVAQVQGAVVAACSFLPTAASVVAMITASPLVATADGIATIICSAITAIPPASSAQLKAVPGPYAVNVIAPNGATVTVSGSFVSVKGVRVN